MALKIIRMSLPKLERFELSADLADCCKNVLAVRLAKDHLDRFCSAADSQRVCVHHICLDSFVTRRAIFPCHGAPPPPAAWRSLGFWSVSGFETLTACAPVPTARLSALTSPP